MRTEVPLSWLVWSLAKFNALLSGPANPQHWLIKRGFALTKRRVPSCCPLPMLSTAANEPPDSAPKTPGANVCQGARAPCFAPAFPRDNFSSQIGTNSERYTGDHSV